MLKPYTLGLSATNPYRFWDLTQLYKKGWGANNCGKYVFFRKSLGGRKAGAQRE